MMQKGAFGSSAESSKRGEVELLRGKSMVEIGRFGGSHGGGFYFGGVYVCEKLRRPPPLTQGAGGVHFVF